jgi:peroxiredoxin
MDFRRTATLALAVLILAALAPACTKTDRSAMPIAPDFTLQDLSGRSVRLADFKGKVVLVEFWATWCPPCRESIPAMERMHKTYGSKGLVILSISLDAGDWADVKEFAEAAGITYRVLKGTDEVMEQYMVRSIPSAFLVNRQGLIAKQYIGGGYDDYIEKEIRSLL